MNKLIDTIRRRFYDIRPLDRKLPAVLEKRVSVKFGDIHHRLMLPLRPGEHLILPRIAVTRKMSDIGNVHHSFHVISRKTQILLQHIFHDITSQISDMGKMIHGRAARIHRHFSFRIWLEQLHLPRKRIV